MGNFLKYRNNPRVAQGFISRWCSNYGIFTNLETALANITLFNDINYLFSNPSDAFVSFMAFPFDVETYCWQGGVALQSNVRLGKHDLGFAETIIPTSNFYRNIGKLKIERKFNNFLDFAPYTKIELYVPYCSIVTLDTNVVMGKEIRLFYSVDFGTGGCTCYIATYENENDVDEDGNVIMVVNGQVGFEIPLGSTNKNEQAKQMLANALSVAGGTIVSIVTENPSMLLATAFGGIKNTLSAKQERIQKGGAVGGYQALVSPTKAYLIRTTLKPLDVDYAHEKGLPLMETRNLSTLKGFTRVEDVHLDGFAIATSSELDEIENLLNVGVIL